MNAASNWVDSFTSLQASSVQFSSCAVNKPLQFRVMESWFGVTVRIIKVGVRIRTGGGAGAQGGKCPMFFLRASQPTIILSLE